MCVGGGAQNVAVGAKTRQCREALGLTQQDLAKKLYVTVQAVSQWENNRTQPDADRLLQLAKVLETTTDMLLDKADTHLAAWQLSGRMFSEEHMYSKLKAFVQAELLKETYRALPYMREHHEGQTRDSVKGSSPKVA